MRAKRLLTIAVVSTLLLGGVAALGAANPAEQANDNATDAVEENAPEDADDENASEDASNERANGDTPGDADGPDSAGASGNAGGVGPSGGLPEQVPDHVSEIHDRIDSFLSGSIDDLGGSLGEGDPADDAADEGDSENADGDDSENEDDESDGDDSDTNA